MNMSNGWELGLVLLVVVLVFGSKRLPESARALGKSMRILKAETKGLHDDDRSTSTSTSATQVVAPASPPQQAPYVPPPGPASHAPAAGQAPYVPPGPQPGPVAPEQAPHRPA